MLAPRCAATRVPGLTVNAIGLGNLCSPLSAAVTSLHSYPLPAARTWTAGLPHRPRLRRSHHHRVRRRRARHRLHRRLHHRLAQALRLRLHRLRLLRLLLVLPRLPLHLLQRSRRRQCHRREVCIRSIASSLSATVDDAPAPPDPPAAAPAPAAPVAQKAGASWERPWTLVELKESATEWTLASDAGVRRMVVALRAPNTHLACELLAELCGSPH